MLDATAALSRGLELHRQGRLDEAAVLYEDVLRADAGRYEAVYYLGLVQCAAGRYDRALELALRGVEIAPDSYQALAQAGGVLSLVKRPHEALPYLERALALAPDRLEILNNLGAVLRTVGRLPEALALFTRALEIEPNYADARYNLAGTLSKLDRFVEAIPHYEWLLSLRPDSADTYSALGRALWKADRLDDAIAAFGRAIAIDPNHADAYGNFGNVMTESGRFDEAVAAFERAIGIAPERGEFYRYLAETRLSAVTADHVAALERLADDPSLSDDSLVDVNFALGKIHAASDRQRSFRHLVRGNTHRRRFMTYDEAETLDAFERIAAVFDAGFLSTRHGCSDPSPIPIFIFGMPRSGTTLIEQILASHARVFGAGELPILEQIATDVLSPGGAISPAAMLAATCDRLREIGQRYVAALKKLAPSTALRVTDKMPANFRYAGLIHTVLPRARMIHARRDPVDTCLSCFSHNFAGEMSWAYDLAELGRYYRGYDRLMEHWRTLLPPDAWLEVRYEDVVDDVERQARRIVAYCGLEWDDACLEFYKTERPVRTASATQVRRPIYRSSINQSRAYGDLLAPLIDALGPVAQ